jgi:uncharacterized protein YdaU (DUF1376 family)
MKAPAFQFYPKQYLADDNVLLMDWTARGMHLHLMCIAWQQPQPCTLPDDDAILRKWCEEPQDWERLKAQIFRAWKLRNGRWVQDGLRREYQKQREFSKSRQRAAKARWEKDSDAHALHMQSKCNALQSSSSSSSSELKKKKEEKRAGSSSPTPAASRKVFLADEEFIQALKANPAYQGIDIDIELAKIDAWLLTARGQRKKKTRTFVVNWLNTIERPLSAGNGRALCTRRIQQPGERFLKPCGKPVVENNGASHPFCAECLGQVKPVDNVRRPPHGEGIWC